MPYLRIWVHLIWSTKNREPYIDRRLRSDLLRHIRENALQKGIRLDELNAVSDHVHALISLNADQSIARIAQLIKGESSHWVNQEERLQFKFEWQDEYLALSVSESAVASVRQYIRNQEEHHRARSFAEEYDAFMHEYGLAILERGNKGNEQTD